MNRSATTSACVGWDLTNIENRPAFRKEVRGRSVDGERFAMVVAMLAEKVEANNAGGIRDALVAVQSVSADLLAGWDKAVQLSNDILKTFGEDEDAHD